MKFLTLLSLLTYAAAKVVLNECPDGVYINNVFYKPQVLKTDIDSPYQLAVDYNTDTLFFSYTANADEVFKSAHIDLKTNEFGIIPGISGGFANAVDDVNHFVYLGGNNGIYQYDYATKKAKYLKITDSSIWQLFYQDGLYYVIYPDETAYVYKNGNAKRVDELTNIKSNLIAVDRNNNIIHSNSSGLFYQKNKETFKIGNYVVNAFTKNIKGDIFFSTPGAIYYINEESKQAEKVVQLTNIYGVAMDRDGNVIYADNDSIISLRPSAVC